MTSTAQPHVAAWHRPDITGLRSLAIIPVVAFHAGISAIPGGFVGVDVFYVISGFLITTLLVRDATAGRLNLAEFWARRLRRLLPASVAMVGATLLAAIFILSPLRWPALGGESIAALFYVSNFRFAFQKTDYFAADVAMPSPLIHTWSLGVEEQFYIIWPIVILIVALLARKSKLGVKFHLFWVFALMAAISLYLSITLSITEPNIAFYLLPTRVWEFALAGILALAYPYLKLPVWMRTAAGVVGFVALVASLFVIHSGTTFPGKAALLPVGATLLLILSGPRDSSELVSLPAKILSLKPFVWIGDISYSWYLWHWPFIILVPIALENDSLVVKLGAALASLVVAVLSYKYLENPVRFHPKLVKSVGRTLLVSVLAVAPVTAGAIVATNVGQQSVKPVVDGSQLNLNQARFPRPVDPCDRTSVLDDGTKICESGDLDSDVVLLLVGDSHAGHWRASFSEAAKKENVRLVARWRPACPVVGVRVTGPEGQKVSSRGCASFRRATLELIKELKPQGVVLSQSDGYYDRILSQEGEVIPMDAQLDVWEKAFDELIDELTPLTDRVSVVLDNPRLDYDPNDCLAKFGSTIEGCAQPLEEALDDVAPLHDRTVDLLEERDVTTLNTAEIVCKNDICPVYDEGELVWRDFNHLTRPWTLTQVPLLQPFIRAAVAP